MKNYPPTQVLSNRMAFKWGTQIRKYSNGKHLDANIFVNIQLFKKFQANPIQIIWSGVMGFQHMRHRKVDQQNNR